MLKEKGRDYAFDDKGNLILDDDDDDDDSDIEGNSDRFSNENI